MKWSEPYQPAVPRVSEFGKAVILTSWPHRPDGQVPPIGLYLGPSVLPDNLSLVHGHVSFDKRDLLQWTGRKNQEALHGDGPPQAKTNAVGASPGNCLL